MKWEVGMRKSEGCKALMAWERGAKGMGQVAWRRAHIERKKVAV